MTQTMRVSLPGHDALTDGTVDNYALYADQDNILIKEFTRGTTLIQSGNTGQVAHNFGYIPSYLVYTQVAGGSRYRISNAFDPFGAAFKTYADTANLYFTNNTGTANNVVYYVFYDNI